MIEASCHCGAVRLEIASPPRVLTDCNCSICRRYGVLWAYYPAGQVRVIAPDGTDTYAWDDRSIAFHRCRACGCVTHWSALTWQDDRMGVNARLMDAVIVRQARIRHLDGAVSEQYID
jgi:hypothetical protein